jgi:hypothetical protein
MTLVVEIIGFWLLLLFLPFLVSLPGTKTFAFLSFLASSTSVTAVMSLAFSGGLGGAPPNPSADIKYEAVIWAFWLAAWVCAIAGIWQRRRKKSQLLGPVRGLYLTGIRELLRDRDQAYSDWKRGPIPPGKH